ncbi:MAG: hypothetical protein IJN70_07655 [Clostridia bacterium]|nr:hypothetical protein [Clostridia bacterium]
MKCPKCGIEIARFDLSPNCKKCGVHIMYYTQEEDLRRDAKKTELEFTSARLFVAKLKAAYIKGKPVILRFVFLLLGICSLLLPIFNVKLSFPWWEYEISVGALGIYNMFTDSLWTMLNAFADIGVGRLLFVITLISLLLLVITALSLVGCFCAWLLSFVNIRKTAKIAIGFAVPAVLAGIGSTVLSFIAVNLSGAIEFVTVKPYFGGVLSVLIMAAYIAANAAVISNPPEIPVSDADKKRLEIKEKVKKGEISLDDLPLPIIEEEKKPEEAAKKKRGKKK